MGYGQTPKDAGGIPISSVYVPNAPGGAGFYALQGSQIGVLDAYNNRSAGVVVSNEVASAIFNGQGYVACTGILATASSNLTMGLSVFNPTTSTKSLYVTAIKWHTAATLQPLRYHLTTADPAYPVIQPVINLKGGGPASVASVTTAPNGATNSLSMVGTVLDILFVQNVQQSYELLLPNAGVMLTPGYGVVVYGVVPTSGNSWGATVRWLEF